MAKRLTSDIKKLYIVSITLFALLFLALFIPTENSRILAVTLLVPAAAIVLFLIRKRSIHSINKRQVLLIMTVLGLLWVLMLYLLGKHYGYLWSPYHPLSPRSFLNQLLPTILIIISVEIIRGILLDQKDKIVNVISYLSCLIAEVMIYSNIVGITTFNSFMDFMALTLFPAVSANLLYHYLSSRYGCMPCIAFRGLITLYPFIFSVVPGIPDALLSFASILFPLLIYLFISFLYDKRRVTHRKSGKWAYAGAAVTVLIMISIVMIISCQFRFGALVIGSESMTGELNKGDTAIYEKLDDQPIKEGQVIVFEKNKTVIVHRVVDIQTVNGITRYYTKGDANEDLDAGYILRSDIIGLVDNKIPYIGYPTIWLRSLFN
ncbi:MAG: signal peptidase I [Clostridia bacterium]|nr:signal peptidase I [Clostridia bacterium]